MEYQRFGSDIIVRMDRGEEILSGLKEVCLKEKVKLASIYAIGAVDEFQVGLYDVEKREYESRTYTGPYEILSLLGNVTTKNGEYTHISICPAPEKTERLSEDISIGQGFPGLWRCSSMLSMAA